MKISLNWLKELVDYKLDPQQLADQLSLKTIGVKQVANDFLELDLTYNRGDLLSLRSVAREVAAITDSPVKFKEDSVSIENSDLSQLAIEVEDENLCSVYCLVKIEGIKVEQSDETWVKKLSDCGIRAINNIADVTNLIMLEYGQPMHAFDADKVNGRVSVRKAIRDERIKTLDDKTRELDTEDLVIADEEGPIAIAGVMGGKNSEVSDYTTSILLEAAIFDPATVRKTSKKLGLFSEASKRFQHGLSKTNLLQALSAAIKMYEELGGKITSVNLSGNLEDKPKIIELNHTHLNSLIGADIPAEQVESSLKSLGFHLESVRTNYWKVIAPFWRLDIEIEEDLVEEVVRMYGYEKIPAEKINTSTGEKIDQGLPDYIYDLKVKLKDIGLTEIQTYSFYGAAVLEALEFTKEDKNILVKIANPISSETEYMRMDIWPNLLEVVEKNVKHGFKDIAVFEIGKVYSTDEEKPNENYRLSIALMNNTDNPIEELAIIVKSISKELGGVNLKATNQPPISQQLFHPKRFINIEKNGKMIAGIAEIHLRLLNNLGIEKRVAVMEIDIEPLI